MTLKNASLNVESVEYSQAKDTASAVHPRSSMLHASANVVGSFSGDTPGAA